MPEVADITRSQAGLDGVSWNVLGQVYVPKQVTEESFAWHATFPRKPSCRPMYTMSKTNTSSCSKAAST